MLHREAVVLLPLDEPDPDRHLGQVERVGIDLDPEELMRSDLQLEFRQAPVPALDQDRFLQVLEQSQGDVQEVPRAAGRVQDSDRSEAFQEGVDESLGLLDM